MKDKILAIIEGKSSKTFGKLINSRPTIKLQVDDYSKLWNTENVNETIYCIINEIIPPKCPCGNKALFNSFNKGYRQYCSNTCKSKNDSQSNRMRQQWSNPERLTSMLEQMKKTNIERYGVEYPLQSEKVIADIKKKNLENTGYETPFQNPSILEKTRNTLLINHGVEYAFQSPEIRKKAEESFINNHGHANDMSIARKTYNDTHGVENAFQVPEVKEKIKQQLLSRYGVEHPLQNSEIMEQMKKNVLDKYGVDNVAQSPEIQQKIKETCVLRYGVENSSQRHYDSVTHKFMKDDITFEAELAQTPVAELIEKYNTTSSTIYKRARELGIKPVVPPFTGRSSFEIEVEQFIRQHYNGTIVLNTRNVISPQELDIWLPELNFAIECNGTWWHSELGGKNHTYHFEKTNRCREHGVQLFHLWEHVWYTKPEIVKSMLLSRIKLSTRIPARKCKVLSVSNSTAVNFFKDNHIQGNAGFKVALGIFHNDTLVMCASFAKPRYNKQYEWELIRLASLKGHVVIGGASKLMKAFINQYNPPNLLSYCDRSYGTGNVYEQLGFEFSHVSDQNYWYTQNHIDFYHRSKFQKHKLGNILSNFDPQKTEWENMVDNGWNRIFDSGNDVYIWKKV